MVKKLNSYTKSAIKIMGIFIIAALMICLIPLAEGHVHADSEGETTFQVTLHANGGSFKTGGYGVVDEDTCIVTFTVSDTGGVSFVNVDMRPTWEGKKLIGWSTDKNAEWETWSEWFEQYNEDIGRYKFALPTDGSITDLYAVYTDVYHITLDANGGYFGTKTDRYGNVSYIETFEAELWNTKGGVSYYSVPDVLTKEDGVEHVGWSADKNAKIPEYRSPGGFILNADTPEVMYAVFADPDAGEAKISVEKTEYNLDLKNAKTGRIDYSIQWTGADDLYSKSISVKPQGDISGILKYKDTCDWEFKPDGDKYVCNGWIEYEALKAGTANLVIRTSLNEKEAEQVITFNIAGDPSDDPVKDNPSEQPEVNPAAQIGEDGTALGKGASAEAAEAAITGMKSDTDLPGAVFNKLQLKSGKQTSTSVTLTWKKVSGAKTYVIYGNKCGKSNKMKRLGKSTGKSRKIQKILGQNLKKGTYYKFMIVALDKNNKVVSSSKIVHVATKGGKAGNVGKVTTKAKKNKVTAKKGKKFKLAGKQTAASKKLAVKKHRVLKYESTNSKVATVTKNGVIKGKKKGTCYVYVYAQNGVFAKVKVTVK